jgi:hypothetical protein
MRMPRAGALVHVTWVDIQTEQRWSPAAERLGVAEVETVGWVTAVDREVVELAACRFRAEGEVNLRICIPRVNVKRWAKLQTKGSS